MNDRQTRYLQALTILVLVAFVSVACSPDAQSEKSAVPSPSSREVATYAVENYSQAALDTLRELVAFETVHVEGTANADNPEFQAMTEYLANKAAELGLDFEDHGAVVIIGLGDAEDRIGIVAHADVQPADASKWEGDPFLLDEQSEPGRLVGRGTEDDKGPLACGLWAMKALSERQLPLARRVELIIAYTEESDWAPIRQFLASWDPPAINIAFDAEYPVVVAEKGWGQVMIKLPTGGDGDTGTPYLASFSGGAFLSQVPEDAVAEIAGATDELAAALAASSPAVDGIETTIERDGDRITVRVHGVSAHSSTPWEGRNAITHLAALLGRHQWPTTAAADVMRLINDLIGTGDNAEKFGELAYSDPFMGPLTLTLATLEEKDGLLTAGVSFRRPAGRDRAEVELAVKSALDGWRDVQDLEALTYELAVYDPYQAGEAPQVPVLLDVFSHYTGIEDPQPISIGGGTNAGLLPNGVSFGPSMPGVPYTGHSEHEFIGREQFILNLEMYTAVLAELAGE